MRRVKTDVIKAHWDDVVRLVASLKAGTVSPPMNGKISLISQCKKLAARTAPMRSSNSEDPVSI
jgi:Tn3 transposase DDE domain